MKGANAEPSVKIIKIPKSSNMIIMGANHQRLRTRINAQNSLKIENFDLISLHIPIFNCPFPVARYPFLVTGFINPVRRLVATKPSSATPAFPFYRAQNFPSQGNPCWCEENSERHPEVCIQSVRHAH